MHRYVQSKLTIVSLVLTAAPVFGGTLWWPVTDLKNEERPPGPGIPLYYLVFGAPQVTVGWQPGPVSKPSAESG